MAIQWKTEKSESTQEQVSPDGRWHISGTTADGVTRLYLTNYDLLCSPSAFGEAEAECWRRFVESCDQFAERLAKVREEAAAVAEEMEKIGQ